MQALPGKPGKHPVRPVSVNALICSDRLWQAGELNTTDYLVQLKQALDTEVSATEQRGRMWRAWADWLAASGQADQWLNLAGDTQ